MNDILKQRLVGALILVALGVVFWPVIFVQPEGSPGAQQPSIPLPPTVSTAPLEAPDRTGLRASPEPEADSDSTYVETPQVNPLPDGGVSNATEASTPALADSSPAEADAGGVRDSAPEPLAMDSDGVPLAWTLQIATVSSAEKADGLRRQLLEMQQKAYVTTVSSGGRRLYRVSVGPKFERAELEKLQKEIDAKFGVRSLVARYSP